MQTKTAFYLLVLGLCLWNPLTVTGQETGSNNNAKAKDSATQTKTNVDLEALRSLNNAFDSTAIQGSRTRVIGTPEKLRDSLQQLIARRQKRKDSLARENRTLPENQVARPDSIPTDAIPMTITDSLKTLKTPENTQKANQEDTSPTDIAPLTVYGYSTSLWDKETSTQPCNCRFSRTRACADSRTV